ncbi:MAG: chemotaxis protein CheX [Magnetococcales bacterium]|nr:chemotaxis protein CheX [Magnetococcales bacterium]MBF0149188.1 chemotaxis protein CheX [Magnetococcales bacterium]MBF0629618.1 chemotaxis protein CheX [Magnetococcales bacterium]
MFLRQHERIAFDTEAVLYFPDKKEFICKTLDISVGGIKVARESLKELYGYIGDHCIVELALTVPNGLEMKSVFLQSKAVVVNGDIRGIGVKFEGLDHETLTLLEKVVSRECVEEDLSVLKSKEGITVKPSYNKVLVSQLDGLIVESVKEVFIAFLGIDVVPGPYMERPAFQEYKPPETEVTGIVLFNGALEGGIHLSSPMHFAIKAAGAMLGVAGLDLEKQQEDMVWDALGEITNQVAGGVQTRISSSFESISLTAPNIVIGPKFRINYSKNLTSVRKFFRTPYGPFFIECFFS